jgi:hypothetical protein
MHDRLAGSVDRTDVSSCRSQRGGLIWNYRGEKDLSSYGSMDPTLEQQIPILDEIFHIPQRRMRRGKVEFFFSVWEGKQSSLPYAPHAI